MKFIQVVGPLSKKQFFEKTNVTYLQIGIEYPHSIPISCYTDDMDWPLVFSIDDDDTAGDSLRDNWHNFVMTEKDIYEQRWSKANVKIRLEDTSNPYFIINIAYEDAT